MTLIATIALGLSSAVLAEDRVLRTELELDGPVSEVWKAWTTEEGVRTFFARGAHIEPSVDGLYEIYFDPEAEPGSRGAEGMRILALEPERRFAFTWNAPLSMPSIRRQRTMVVIELEPLARNRTRLRLTHSGWGQGDDWDRAYAYFDKAWNQVVLPRLVHRFTRGPVDWSADLKLDPVSPTMRVALHEAGR